MAAVSDRRQIDPNLRVRKNQTLLRRGLEIPDGIAPSHDGCWIAVRNHARNNVLVFDAARRLDRHNLAVAVWRNANYPHGLRSTADDSHILAADAGAPLIHVHHRQAAGWKGACDPNRSAVVLDTLIFQRGWHPPKRVAPKALVSTNPIGSRS